MDEKDLTALKPNRTLQVGDLVVLTDKGKAMFQNYSQSEISQVVGVAKDNLIRVKAPSRVTATAWHRSFWQSYLDFAFEPDSIEEAG